MVLIHAADPDLLNTCCQVFRLSLSDETAIASILDDVAKSFSEVQVGSYTVSSQEDGAQILVTLDSKQVRQFKQQSAADCND